ncbi:DUF6932 family protein [uncultured Methanobrevibacter sp.]|uniref:DUF6932 family protein n=1 Tax=uncultured Methanobrevibacter sp. TaxID=253161 RepID=UPI0025DC4ED0|nr:nucleotidyltransferase domain-containing protein [uncultured Methanobrevibacter sp.]
MAKDNIPPFDERGCLPEGIYNPTVEDFMERFANVNERRKELFGKYQQFTKLCNDAKGIEEHYLDGSYVRNKEKPGDIDLLITFNKEDLFDNDGSLNKYAEIIFNQPKMKLEYEMHVFYSKIIKESDSDDEKRYWENHKNSFLEWWGNHTIDRKNGIIDDKKKGFIVFNKDDLQKIGAW